MNEKDFNCEQEDVPAISGIVVSYYLRDIADFSEYSTEFTTRFGEAILIKRKVCLEMKKSGEVKEEMKSVTQLLNDKKDELRLKLNKIEGYLDLTKDNLDLPVASFGLAALRDDIKDRNIEGMVMHGNTLVSAIIRNKTALMAKGMKEEFVVSLKALVDELDSLKISQKGKKSERSHTTNDNIKEFNELWEMTTKILKAARAIYRGEDNLKMKDYTLSNLMKQARPKDASDKEEVMTSAQ